MCRARRARIWWKTREAAVTNGDPDIGVKNIGDVSWRVGKLAGELRAPVPIANAGVGLGGDAHAANEFDISERAGKVYGMAGAEEVEAAVLYNLAGKN